jgi:hypothetical protein
LARKRKNKERQVVENLRELYRVNTELAHRLETATFGLIRRSDQKGGDETTADFRRMIWEACLNKKWDLLDQTLGEVELMLIVDSLISDGDR